MSVADDLTDRQGIRRLNPNAAPSVAAVLPTLPTAKPAKFAGFSGRLDAGKAGG